MRKSCWISTVNYQKQIDFLIADTLEKVQHLNPELYGQWYSKLYAPHGDIKNWNVKTLHTLEQLIIDYTNWKQCYSLNNHSTINKFSLSLLRKKQKEVRMVVTHYTYSPELLWLRKERSLGICLLDLKES